MGLLSRTHEVKSDNKVQAPSTVSSSRPAASSQSGLREWVKVHAPSQVSSNKLPASSQSGLREWVNQAQNSGSQNTKVETAPKHTWNLYDEYDKLIDDYQNTYLAGLNSDNGNYLRALAERGYDTTPNGVLETQEDIQRRADSMLKAISALKLDDNTKRIMTESLTGISSGAAVNVSAINTSNDIKSGNKFISRVYEAAEQGKILPGYDEYGKALVNLDREDESVLGRYLDMAEQNIGVDDASAYEYARNAWETAGLRYARAQQELDEAMGSGDDARYAAAKEELDRQSEIFRRADYLYDTTQQTSQIAKYAGMDASYNADIADPLYKYINGGDTSVSYKRYDYMSDDEKRTYNAIANSEGIVAANNYLDMIEPYINQRATDEKTQNAEYRTERLYTKLDKDERKTYREIKDKQGLEAATKYLENVGEERGWLGRTLASGTTLVGTAVMSPLKAAAGLSDGLASVDWITQDAAGNSVIDVNDPLHRIGHVQRAIREESKENLNTGVGRFAYDVVASSLDSYVNSLVASGITNVLGYAPGTEAASNAVKALTNVLMTSEAIGDSTVEAVQNGYSPNEAAAIGTMRGLFEAITETVSLEMIMGNPSEALRRVLKDFAAEGSEEVASNFLNNIFDIIIGDENGIVGEYKAKVADGMDKKQAFKEALLRLGTEDLMAFLAGGLSGAMMGETFSQMGYRGAGKVASKAANALDTQLNASKYREQQISTIMSADSSITREQAEQIYDQQKTDAAKAATDNGLTSRNAQKAADAAAAGKTISDKQAYSLSKEEASVRSENLKNGITNIRKDAIETRLNERGETGDVSKLADIIAREVGGRRVTAAEHQAVLDSHWGYSVLSEAKDSNPKEWVAKMDAETASYINKTSAIERGTYEKLNLDKAAENFGEQAEAFKRIYNMDAKDTDDVTDFYLAFEIVENAAMTDSQSLDSLLANPNVSYVMNPEQIKSAYAVGAGLKTETASGALGKAVSGLKTTAKGTARHAGVVRTAAGTAITNETLDSVFSIPQDSARSKAVHTAYRVLSRIAEVTGIDIVLTDNQTVNEKGQYVSEEGHYSATDSGTIYIDINSGLLSEADKADVGKYTMIRVFSHEFTHFLESWNAEAYVEFRKLVFDTMNRNLAARYSGNGRVTTVDDIIKYRMNSHNKAIDAMNKADGGNRKHVTYEGASREVVAEAMTEILPETEFIQDLYFNHRKLFDKLNQKLGEFVMNLNEAFNNGVTADKFEVALVTNNINGALKYAKDIVKAFNRMAKQGVENYQKAVSNLDERVTGKTEKALEKVGLVATDGIVTTVENAAKIHDEGMQKPADPLDQHSVKTQKSWKENFTKLGGDGNVAEQMDTFVGNVTANDAIMGWIPNGNYAYNKMGPLRKNVEYRWTFDMDASCPRTFQFVAYRDRLQAIAGRPLTQNESLNLMYLMKRMNQSIPCTYCYVENKRIMKSVSYLNWFAARQAVMNAASDEEARRLMYSYSEKKDTISKAAQKVFDEWRADANAGKAFAPSAEECWTGFQTATNTIYNFLDEQLANNRIKYGVADNGKKEKGSASRKALVTLVAKEFGVSMTADKEAIKEIEGIVDQWQYDIAAGTNHVYAVTNDTDNKTIDKRFLKLHRLASNYASSVSQARLVDNFVPYTDQVKNISAADKAFIMGMGGIRKHSSNDFRIDYVVDYFQFYADLAAGGWTGHTYTKSIDFCKIFGKCHDRINLSIAMETMNGKISPNVQEGADWRDAQQLRKDYDDIGTMAMVTDNMQLAFALNSDWIDMVIPFHASGLPKAVWYNLRAWFDYTTVQLESYYTSEEMKQKLTDSGVDVRGMAIEDVENAFNETFGIKILRNSQGNRVKPHFFPNDTYVNGQLVPGHHNDVATYKRLCDEYGVHPRFWGTQVSDKDGNMMDVTDHPGYIKLIKETARTDNEQKPIEFNFGEVDEHLGMSPMDYAMKALNEFASRNGFEGDSADPMSIVNLFDHFYLGKNREIGWMPEGDIDSDDPMTSKFYAVLEAGEKAYREMYYGDTRLLDAEGYQKALLEGESDVFNQPQDNVQHAVRDYDGAYEFVFNGEISSKQFVDGMRKANDVSQYFPSGLKDSFKKAITKKNVFTAPRVYRGMDQNEFDSIVQNGFIASNGSYNFANQQGMTFFDEDAGYALSYATSFAPKEIAAKHYEQGVPSYVVEVINSPELNLAKNSVQESFSKGEVPQEYISRIFAVYADENGNDTVEDITDTMRLDLPNIGKAKDGMSHGLPMFVRDKTTGTVLYAVQGEDGWENGRFISEKDPSITFGYDNFTNGSFTDIAKKMLGVSGDINDLEEISLDAQTPASAQGNKNTATEDGTQFEVRNIVGKSGTDYGLGVYLDSTDLDGAIDETDRRERVRTFVSNMGGKSFAALDYSGELVQVYIAEQDEQFENEKGDLRYVNQDLLSSLNKDVKKYAILQISELFDAGEPTEPSKAHHKHGELDDFGKNKWERWTVILQDKNGIVYSAAMHVANSTDGRKILYDVYPITQIDPETKKSNSFDQGMALKTVALNEGTATAATSRKNIAQPITESQGPSEENSQHSVRNTSGMTEEEIQNANSVISRLRQTAIGSRYLEDYVGLSPDRMRRVINDSVYKGKLDTTKNYIAWIDPTDFVYATTTRTETRQRISEEAGSLDMDRLRSEMQPIYLRVNMDTGEIVGHEGRHRLTALSNAGVRRVAVIITSDTAIDNAQPISLLKLKGQSFDGGERRGTGFYAHSMMPITERYADTVSDLFGNAKVSYSVRSSVLTERDILRTAADAARGTDNVLGMEAASLVENLTSAEKDALRIYGNRLAKLDAAEQTRRGLLADRKALRNGREDAELSTSEKEALQSIQNNLDTVNEQRRRINAQLLAAENTGSLRKLAEKARPVLASAAVEKERTAVQKYAERRDESEGRGKYKKKITDTVKMLSDWIERNSDKEHVPEILREPVIGLIESIDESSKRLLNGGAPTKADKAFAENLTKLKQLVDGQQNVIEGDAASVDQVGAYLDLSGESKAFLRDLVDVIASASGETFTLNRMNAEQLRSFSKFMDNLAASIRQANRLLANARYQNLPAMGQATMQHFSQLGKAKDAANGALNKFVFWQNATPFYAFRRYGTAGESVFDGLTRGWEKFAKNARDTIQFTDELYDKYKVSPKELNEWRTKLHEFTLESGDTIKMTTAQIMELSQLLNRGQARQHIEAGGIRIGDIARKRGGDIQDTRHHHFTANDFSNILKTLTDRQMNIATELRKYMGNTGGRWGNEISMARFGYNFYTEGENYYTIKTDSNDRAMQDTDAQTNSMFRLLNLSASKPLTPHANNALIVGDIFNTFSDHMSDMAKLNGLGLPILDAIKWYNYTERTDNGDGTFDKVGVKSEMESALGKYAGSYFRTLIKDINGVHESGDRGADFASKMISNYKIAAVAANLRVALLQPTSYVRAMNVIRPKYLFSALNAFKTGTANKAYKEALQYSGTADWKDLGFYDTDIARSVRSQIEHDQNWADAVKEKSMILAEKGDSLTWGRLWIACKLQTKASNPNLDGKALMEKTGDLFREVVYGTQVMDSTLTRSEMMRGNTKWTKLATAFMAEPTLSLNLLMDSASEFNLAKRKVGAKLAWKGNERKIIRAFISYVCAAAASAVVESLADAMRDDDDYETYWQKVLQAFIGEDGFVSGNLGQDLTIVGKIPIIKDVISTLKGDKSSDMSIASVESVSNAISIWGETIKLANGELEKPTEITWNGKMTTYGKIYKTLQALSQLSGLPGANLTRDAIAIWNTTVGGANPDLKLKSYDPGTKNSVKYAYQDGTMNAKDAAAELIANGDAEDENEAYWLMRSWDTGETSKYSSYVDALHDGDAGAIAEAANELTSHGVDAKDVQTKANSEIGKMYDEGEITEKQALNMMQQYGGLDATGATKKMAQWKYAKYDSDDSGSVSQDELSEAFERNNMPQEERERIWSEFGFKTEYNEEVQEKAAARVELDENAVIYNSANWEDGLKDDTLPDSDKDTLVTAYGGKWFAEPYTNLRAAGYAPSSAYDLLSRMDADGNHSVKQAEAHDVLRNMSEEEATKIWDAFGWKKEYATYAAYHP